MKSLARLATILLVLCFPAICQAEAIQQTNKTVEIGDYYLGVAAGGSIPTSVHASLERKPPLNVSASGNLSLKPTGRFSLQMGYYARDWFAIEFEGAHANYAYGELPSSLFFDSPPGLISGPLSFNGNSDVWVAFVNVIIKPFGRPPKARLSPYIGGGIGMAATRWTRHLIRELSEIPSRPISVEMSGSAQR